MANTKTSPNSTSAKAVAIDVLKKELTTNNIKFPEDASLETLEALSKAFIVKTKQEESSIEKGNNKFAEMEKLIRVKVICNNPEKRSHKGEFIGAGNSFGTIRAFVPYNCSTAEDMMVPRGLVEVLRHREYLHVREYTDKERHNLGTAIMHTNTYSKEFTIIELPME